LIAPNRPRDGEDRVSDQVSSPCVNVCQLDSDTGYCIGCMRTLDEIADWLELNNEEKRQVLSKLEDRRKAAA